MTEQTSFSSRWALMFAMLSMAVGTGNIWRFPRIVAQNGGGTFLVPWIVFLFAWSIPLIITEFALGRGLRAGPLGSLVRLNGPRFAWCGAWITLVATGIMFYYSVITGWVLGYLCSALGGMLSAADTDHQQYFNDFLAGYWPSLLHLASMGLALLVIGRGVAAIERVTSLLLPSLFVLVAVLAIRAMLLPGAGAGLKFLFTVDWPLLANYRIWLEALTQNAWDTGAGWGLITAYAIYMRRQDDGSVNCFLLGLGNNFVSLLAGIAVLCTIFAINPSAQESIVGSGNYGLTFVWIPQLFARMPAGWLFMILFFVALFMAAFTSLVSMVELAVRGLQDLGLSRRRGLVLVGAVGAAGGLPSALNVRILGNQDWVWGTGLVLSGLFFAVPALVYGVDRFRNQYVNVAGNQLRIGRWWVLVLGGLVPAQAVALLVWFAWTSFPDDGSLSQRWWRWLNPLAVENTGTVLAQWAVVLGVLLAANRWMGRQAADKARLDPPA